MEEHREKAGSHGAVPKFGGWESATMPTDYSLVFATARKQKKEGAKIEIPQDHMSNKNNVNDDSIGDHDKGHLISQQHDRHPHKRTWLDRYFTCCIKA